MNASSPSSKADNPPPEGNSRLPLLKSSGAAPQTSTVVRAADLRQRARAALAKPTRVAQNWLAASSPASLTWLWAVSALLVGEIDFLSGPEWSFAIFYLLPVSGAAWFSGKRNGLAVAGLSALIWLFAEFATAAPQPHLIPILWNCFSRLGIFIFVVLMLSYIRALNAGLEQTIARRTLQLDAETARGLAMEREIANISHREQQRIAHELHDGLGQELGGLAFQAKLLAAELARGGTPRPGEADRMVRLLNQSIARTRALSHLLDPVGTESGGLRQALSQLADRSGEAFAVACTFEAPAVLPDLSREAALNLYRIAQEAIHNAVARGGATEVTVNAACDPQQLTLSIADNGSGFVPDTAGHLAVRGMGLRIMRYRADMIGARIEIQSAPGQACKVVCHLPLISKCETRNPSNI